MLEKMWRSFFLDIPNSDDVMLLFLCQNDWGDFMRILILSVLSFGFHCKQPCDIKANAGLALISMKRD